MVALGILVPSVRVRISTPQLTKINNQMETIGIVILCIYIAVVIIDVILIKDMDFEGVKSEEQAQAVSSMIGCAILMPLINLSIIYFAMENKINKNNNDTPTGPAGAH